MITLTYVHGCNMAVTENFSMYTFYSYHTLQVTKTLCVR